MYRSYQVSVKPTVEPVTIGEAKNHLKVDGNEEDAYIGSLIGAARQWIERRCEMGLMTQTIEETWDCFPTTELYELRLRVSPVLQFLKVEYRQTTDGVFTEWASTEYDVLLQTPGYVAPKTGKAYPVAKDQIGAVKLTYKAGFSAANQVPPAIKQAILLLVGQMYENRENTVQKHPSTVEWLIQSFNNWQV